MYPRTLAALAVALGTFATSASATVPLKLAKFSGGINYGVKNSFSGVIANGVSHSSFEGKVGSEVTTLGGLKTHVYGETTSTGYGVIADGRISYYFAVLTGLPGNVHLIINAAAQTFGSGSYFAEAEVDLFGQNTSKTLAYSHVCGAIGGCNPLQNVGTSGGPTNVTLAANQQYEIRMNVNGRVTNPNSSFDAWADPVIMFDPDYSVPSDAAFQFSENLSPEIVKTLAIQPGRGGAVPEPASWALMILGFGAIGTSIRRRRAGPLTHAGLAP